MRKYFAIITISILTTSAFGFYIDRPSGHQLDGSTALWGSFLTEADDIGSTLHTNIGFDYSISNNFELSFDLLKDAGEKIREAHKEMKLTIWAGEAFAFSTGCHLGNTEDSNFFGIKYAKSDMWLSFKSYDDVDLDVWAIGTLWKKENGCSVGISYHFDTDDFDKGILQLTMGKSL